MNTDLTPETEVCPFCHTNLEDKSDRCKQCGAERVVGHINAQQRKKLNLFRAALFIILCGYFYFQLQEPGSIVLLVSVFIVGIILIVIVPHLYYRFKNKNNIIWKRKSSPT